MRIISQIKSLIFFYKARNLDYLKGHTNRRVELSFQFAKQVKLAQWERNGLANVIKRLRTRDPYVVIGYTEAQKMYENYFKIEGHIGSYEELKEKHATGDLYVTKFRNEIPVKGKRFCEYYINYTGGNPVETYKINSFGRYGTDFEYETGYASLDEDDITCYRYATKEEIEEYEMKKAKRKSIESLMDIKKAELGELREEYIKYC